MDKIIKTRLVKVRCEKTFVGTTFVRVPVASANRDVVSKLQEKDHLYDELMDAIDETMEVVSERLSVIEPTDEEVQAAWLQPSPRMAGEATAAATTADEKEMVSDGLAVAKYLKLPKWLHPAHQHHVQ